MVPPLQAPLRRRRLQVVLARALCCLVGAGLTRPAFARQSIPPKTTLCTNPYYEKEWTVMLDSKFSL